MQYVDGVAIRGSPKSHAHFQEGVKSTFEKAGKYAAGAGYAIGLSHSLYEGYAVMRPALQGLGLLA